VLSLGFTPKALRLLAEDLQELYQKLPGVLGRVDAARSFAETWENPKSPSYTARSLMRYRRSEALHTYMLRENNS
jgi:hypothetical protein